MIYTRDALRKRQEEQQQAEDRQAREADLLSRIPADAEMDDAALCVWDGERFVAWDKWLATRPVYTDDAPPEPKSSAAPKQHAAPAPTRGSNDQEGLW